ncbi:MAG: cupin domain-containing protein [Acidobacteria bacterium]|nr:cupin domain-containing protein [Acidobacteriota bacterium]
MRYFFLAAALLLAGFVVYGQIEKRQTLTALLPQDIKFGPSPVLPKGIELANIYADPAGKAEPVWIARVRYAAGARLMPHSHPDQRIVTVLSGTYYQGASDKFDEKKLVAYPPGSFVVVPAGVNHFAWAKDGEVVVQESGITPTGIAYVDPKDDPRNSKK